MADCAAASLIGQAAAPNLISWTSKLHVWLPFSPFFFMAIYIYRERERKKEYNHKVCGQALTVSIKQMLEHHAANTNTILLMHFAVHKCSPCTTAGSLNFQLCNLTHPSCQRPTEGGLKFYRFHNQSASFMDKDQGDTRARSYSSKLQHHFNWLWQEFS